MSTKSMSSGETEVRSYSNWHQPRTAGMFGLGSLGTAMLFGAMIFIVLSVMIWGLREAFVVLLVTAGVTWTVSARNADGKSRAQRLGERVNYAVAKKEKSNIYRAGPAGRIPTGTCQLPGIAASIEASEYKDSYGRPFALLHHRSTGTYSVTLGVEPEGSALVDQETIDRQVAAWGGWLASLSDEPDVEAAAVTIETAPDSGTRLRREVERSVDDDAPEYARAMLHDIVEDYPAGSSVIKGYITLTFRAANREGGKRRKPKVMGRELAARLPGLTGGLSSTGAGSVIPLSVAELGEAIRIAYDPAVAPLFDEAHAAGEQPDLEWTDVGPSAHEAEWDGYRHDSGYSCTWEMTVAPRGLVQSNILTRLLAPHNDIARKRVTLLYRPIDPARAASHVEADVNAANFVAESRANALGVPSARDLAALRSAQATASEEAAGAGLLMFGMLVTATILDGQDEEDARAAVSSLGAATRIRLRPVYGSQDSAFAGALPLGLILQKHLQVPDIVRERL